MNNNKIIRQTDLDDIDGRHEVTSIGGFCKDKLEIGVIGKK